ncbi:MAG TPA: Type 1 glutamine amidotransferase-like domain-containing protein [Thermomicrobiales bacterium]|nr:Type 1 glutamine amidotransferase-like domain-containing protein [Thermomicrobiales bacterium]
MPGALVLAGSGEFTPAMTRVDEELLRHTPGAPPAVAIVPTASGLEGDVPDGWIARGVAHFRALGCAAYGVRVLDRAGAEDPAHAAALARADLIYLSGGNPGYLVATLRDSPAWSAIVAAWERGAALAGSSAGAMALGGSTPVRRERGADALATWESALGLAPAIGVLPHYDRWGRERAAPRLAAAPAGLTILGIDEDTVVLGVSGAALVLGRGTVTVWRDGASRVYRAGETLPREAVALP